jgi:hypothetical protein
MIKLIVGAVLLIGAIITWLRMQWAIGKNKREANKIVEQLKNGNYTPEMLEESLGFLVKSKPMPAGADIAAFQRNLSQLTNGKLRGKFKVQYAEMNQQQKGIVIAEGVVKDHISVGSNKEVDVTYPCWLYLEVTPHPEEVRFKSSMPDGKDHHYLLEDISDAIYEHCIK